jgi:hypothetical protein
VSYEVCEAALAEQIRLAVTGITVALNDGTKIQAGAQKIAILKYGQFAQQRIAEGGHHQVDWQIEIELYCRYTTDAEARNNLRDARDAILNRINRFPHLGDTPEVFDAMLISGQRLDQQIQLGGIHYLGELMVCLVQEEILLDYEE